MLILRKSLLCLAAALMLALAPGTTSALPLADFAGSGDNDAGPDLNDVYNLFANPDQATNGDLFNNVGPIPLGDEGDETFMAGEYIAILISSSAARLNTVGYYTDLGTGAAGTDLFSNVTGFGWLDDNGDGSGAFEAVMFTSQSEFGLLNETVLATDASNNETWRSESDIDGVNPNHKIDHFISFLLGDITVNTQQFGMQQLSNAILVGHEDLRWDFADDDYDDVTLIFARLGGGSPLPEPAGALLIGTGVLVLALRRRLS